MSLRKDRRTFLQTAAAGAVAAPLSGLPLPHVSAADAAVADGLVRFDGPVESLVRLIEETPRDKLLEQVATRIRQGTPYRGVLAALLLAGIRNVQPRPSVGFKFHCVLVVHSCHLASLSGPDSDRWLPIFWALDYFKASQADEAERSKWRMGEVNEARVPSPSKAVQQFVEAMDAWDVEKADAATAGLVRSAGATAVFNLFARYAARDYRSIGHKAIYLANAWRTLQVIGWRHAEPILRSLAFALLNHNGQPNPAKSDLAADRPWRENAEKRKRIPAGWRDGNLDVSAANDLLATFREGGPADAADAAIEVLGRGIAPQSLWDGVFVGAGELLMRRPGIIGLHGLTTANAMHYLWRHVQDDQLRRQLLLQSCSFNPMFRESAKARGPLSDRLVDTVKPQAPKAKGANALEEILAEISRDKLQAAAKVQAFLAEGGNGHELVSAARRVLFQKGRNAHDYKFTSAVLEDYGHVSPAWRDRFLSLAVFNLRGTQDADSGLLERTREALGG